MMPKTKCSIRRVVGMARMVSTSNRRPVMLEQSVHS